MGKSDCRKKVHINLGSDYFGPAKISGKSYLPLFGKLGLSKSPIGDFEGLIEIDFSILGWVGGSDGAGPVIWDGPAR